MAKQCAKHAKPDADEARPHAVGKLFAEHMTKSYLWASLSEQFDLTLFNMVKNRFRFIISFLSGAMFRLSSSNSCLVLLSHILILFLLDELFLSRSKLVLAHRTFRSKLTDMDPFRGRISSSLDLPQYLIRAMLGAHWHETRILSKLDILSFFFN